MVGIAILGAGIFAKEAHVPALVANKANILAVYSRSTKSAESLVASVSAAGGDVSNIAVYSDEKPGHGLDELLQRSDIHAVDIALPILVQPDVVRRSLAAGKHVLCEKPIAKDVSDAAELVAEYERVYAPRNLVFSIAEQFRYDRGFARAREIVASGEIGDVTHVHAREWWAVQPGTKYYETEWRKHPEYQGGFILDAGVHFVALIRTVTGLEIVETKSIATQHWPHLPPTDTVNAALRFSNGATGSLSFSCASNKPCFEYIFIGSKGSLTITSALSPDKQSLLTVESVEAKTKRREIREGNGVFEEIKAFLSAAESGTPEKYGNPREALADVAVIESICSGGGIVRQS
ncbi:hypothetical protein VTO42DRAFT_6664 [Malbranchea cinnamomea]